MHRRPPRQPPKRPPSAGAVRARRSRKLRNAGVRVYRLRLHERRLLAALVLRAEQQAERLADDATHEQIEGLVTELVEDFVARWIGPAKKPCA